MKRFLALLLTCASTFGAAGDWTGLAVETNGWQTLGYISGMATNGTFAFGLGSSAQNTNVITSATKMAIPVTSPGYDDTGATTTVTRAVYATHRVRNPTPNDSFPDTTLPGDGTVKLRLAMDDSIYASDVIGTASIQSGLYVTNSVTSAAATLTTVTNLSTMFYPKCIANWAWPGQQLIDSSTMRLRVVAFQKFAQQGRPVRAVKFIATGATSGTVVSKIVTQMIIDRTVPDALLSGEFVADLDISGMTQGELIRCDFIAYPWLGDSTALVDTTLNTYTWPTPYPVAITNRCNRTGALQKLIAVVKATGSDVNGRASTLSDPTAVSSAIYFATPAKAAQQIAATNGNIGAGTIYIYGDVNTFAGASLAYGASPDTWCTVLPYPGETVNFSAQSGDKNFGVNGMIKFKNIGFTGGNTLFSGHIWMDQCTINTASTALAQTWKSWWVTDCTVPQLAQGFVPNASTPVVNLLRGCNLTGFGNQITAMVTMGNTHPTTSGNTFNLQTDLSGGRLADGAIIYNNDFRGAYGAGQTVIACGLNSSFTNGVAIVQNVWEFDSNDSTGSYAPFTSNSFEYRNILMWHNVFTGAKLNFCYNDSGTVAAYRYQVSVIGNIFEDFNIKSDTFAPTSANRIGNWAQFSGVGWRNNTFPEIVGVGAAGQFQPEFIGVNSFGDAGVISVQQTTNALTYLRFIDRKAYGGISETSPTSGGGNYRTGSDAPQLKIPQTAGVWLLPFDLEGNNRGLMDPPGAYASASPRKGGFFF